MGAQFIDANKAGDLARDYGTIYTEVNLIQAAILAAVDQCTVEGGKFTTTVRDSTPMTFVSRVLSVDVVTGGADYYPIPATATFFHPRPVDDGAGNDATADVVVASGEINSFVMSDPGDNYDTVLATVDITGTGDGLATAVLTTQDGAIIGVTVTNQGTLYLVGENIPVVHPGGTGAVLTVASVGGGGNLLSVSIDNTGSGYEPVVATVVITHPSGLGFEGIVQIDAQGLVLGVSVQNGGSGYHQLLPIISITDPGLEGIGAEVTPSVDTITGELLSVEVINGGAHYPPSGTIGTVIAAPTSSGAGATVDVTVAQNIWGTTPQDYYFEVVGQSHSIVIKDQLDYIITYFTNLGYSIDHVVNTSTLSSIMWILNW